MSTSIRILILLAGTSGIAPELAQSGNRPRRSL
jgi:hypothetical protein